MGTYDTAAAARNATGDLSVLLRNGEHDAASLRFALKADNVAINYSKTPIQVPIPQQSPFLIDLGMFRPTISIGGVIDTVQPTPASLTIGGQTYYIPFKNWLENIIYEWVASSETTGELEVEIGDTTYPDSDDRAYDDNEGSLKVSTVANWTGGAVYRVGMQSCRFSLNPAREDRYDFALQFVAGVRLDWVNRGEMDD